MTHDEHGVALPEQGDYCPVKYSPSVPMIWRRTVNELLNNAPRPYRNGLTHNQVMDRYSGIGLDTTPPTC